MKLYVGSEHIQVDSREQLDVVSITFPSEVMIPPYKYSMMFACKM